MQSINTGDKLSFHQLFHEKGLSIEIPIIQRDFAQGRSSKNEIRENFLTALFAHLDAGEPGQDLDFIYGRIFEENNLFIPLDGQQRLTTLFLLHWYLSLVAEKVEDFQSFMLKEHKSRFTYETRTSSREFCNALIANPIAYSGPDPACSISERIANEGWFFLAWKMDPTVSGILVMLDAIEEKFAHHPEFYDRLVHTESPVITFQFLDLQEFQLTDELYIKMNSRGKPLSGFENFKAKFEQRIATLFRDTAPRFHITSEGTQVSKPHADYFSLLIDTTWLNHFWQASGNDPRKVDRSLMNFIRVSLSDQTALSGSTSPNDLKILFKTQDAKYGKHNRDQLSYFSLEALGAVSPASIEHLILSFDQVMRMESLPDGSLPSPFHYQPQAVFEKITLHQFPSEERLRHFAFLRYLIHSPGEVVGLAEWMRVVYNLTENTRIENAEEITRALTEIEHLLSGRENLYLHLTNPDTSIGFFSRKQVQEEKVKAALILRSPRWKELILATEKHFFLNGQLGFLLEFSGILAFWEEHGHTDWEPETDTEYLESFQDYATKAMALFDYRNTRTYRDALLERAVLTKGDYLVTASSNRKHFLNTGLTDRDYSWKRLLRLNSGTLDTPWQIRRGFFKALLDDERFDVSSLESSLEEIILDGGNGWQHFFVVNPALIRSCSRGFIRFDSPQSVYLLTTTRLTYHYELHSYHLYTSRIAGQNFAPFPRHWYEQEYGFDGHSHVEFGSWIYNRRSYKINIYFSPQQGYSIHLFKPKGDLSLENFAEEIADICTNEGFTFGYLRKIGFVKSSTSIEETTNSLTSLTSQLNRLGLGDL